MTTWQWISLMGIALLHTAALFRWGGKIDVIIEEHEKEINRLRESRHDHGNRITANSAEIDNMKADISDLQHRKSR